MKKKIVAMLLMGVMAFSLSACGKKSEANNETTPTTTAAPLVYYEKGGEFYKELKDYSEYVELGKYSGLDIKVVPAEVTEKQMKEIIDGEIKEGTTYKQVKEGVVKETDTVNMDYTGKIDGIAFTGGSATGYTYKINGNFIELPAEATTILSTSVSSIISEILPQHKSIAKTTLLFTEFI